MERLNQNYVLYIPYVATFDLHPVYHKKYFRYALANFIIIILIILIIGDTIADGKITEEAPSVMYLFYS